MAISEFWLDDFGKKDHRRGFSFPVFFGHKMGNKQFFRYNHPGKKTHLWSFFSQNMKNSTFLQIEARNLHSSVLWYAESDGAIWRFSLRFVDFLGMIPPFLESLANFLHEFYRSGISFKRQFFWCVLILKFCVSVFRLLLDRLSPCLQFVTKNCLINWCAINWWWAWTLILWQLRIGISETHITRLPRFEWISFFFN